MGTYLTGAIQVQQSDDKSWDTVATFYFWKNYELQIRVANLYDMLDPLAKQGKLVKDRYWPEDSEDAQCYLMPASEIELLDQDDNGPIQDAKYAAMKAALYVFKLLTHNARVCFWIK